MIGPSARRWILGIVAAGLGLRLLTALLAFLMNAILPMAQRAPFTISGRTHLFWDTFARWDSGWYFGIARHGYEFVEGGRSNLAFFPVYPMLMRFLADAMGGGRVRVYMAGILISWTAFILAMLVLHRLARLELGDDEKAWRTVIFAAVFPFAFFFGVVYTESLFLLFSVTTFYAARTHRWWLVAVAGALVTATRPNGFFMLPALALVVWREVRGGDRTLHLKAAVAVACTLLGVGLYSLFVYSLSGHPFEWARSMARWNWEPGSAAPWRPLASLAVNLATRPIEHLSSSPQAVCDLLNATAGVTLLAAAPFVWRRFGAGYAVLILVNLFVPLSSGFFEGTGRYAAVLFPFALLLATIHSDRVRGSVLVVFGMFYAIALTLFTKAYPLY
jgi:hypothetical protein